MEIHGHNRTRSAQLFERAKHYLPGGVNSPVRAFKSVFGPPLFIEKGNGSRLYDADGHEYIDFCGSWGPLILGHNHPKVKEAILKAVENGTSFGAPTEAEVELASLIVDNHKFIEKIRFVSSGTEAVMSAIRLARGYTGKSKVVKFEGCYHGHVDALMVKAGSGLVTFGVSTSAGIPPAFANETIVLPLNDKDAVTQLFEQHHADIACIIIEPIPANNGLLLQPDDFLQHLRAICTQYQSLLIFDEVISGFRVGFEGAAGWYDIRPDILTFGKIIGGGMPVGAYAASKELMSLIAPDGPVYQAGTLSGNPVAMAAGKAALEILLEEGFYTQLNQKTNSFVESIFHHSVSKGYPLQIPHIGSIFWLAFEKQQITKADEINPASMEYFKQLHLELLKMGIYFGPSGYEVGFVSAAHSEKDLQDAAAKIKEGLDRVFS